MSENKKQTVVTEIKQGKWKVGTEFPDVESKHPKNLEKSVFLNDAMASNAGVKKQLQEKMALNHLLKEHTYFYYEFRIL